MEPGLSSELKSDRELLIVLVGDWNLEEPEAPLDGVSARVRENSRSLERVSFNTSQLGRWDTSLLIALVAVRKLAQANNLNFDDSDLPKGARQLLDLAFSVPEREDARRPKEHQGFVFNVGQSTLSLVQETRLFVAFTGLVTQSLSRFVRGKANYSARDLGQYIQEAGAEALPIVSLLSLLVGMIFAFVGAMQLQAFGVGIYTADLVGVAMVREMAPIMTAIIMAGRTGAAYAAQIGTMKVNEEVDALSTLGIDPIDYLVLPRLLALILMVPLLTLYADLMGIIGGMLVGVFMLNISVLQYLQQTLDSVSLSYLFGGLFKALVYGTLVAMAGCQQGMACGDSAMAVGQSTTKAVVMGIVAIVVSASLLTVIYINLGI